MRTWIAVHLPLLSLETIRPRWCEPGRHVVVDRRQVMAMSPEAGAAGVHIGMRRAGAQSICPDAALHEYDARREQSVLKEIALALLQYTPEVALAEEAGLVLDVTASLRAFGGRLALCRQMRATVLTLGFTPRIGMAPTAQGALLLTKRHDGPRRVVTPASMERQLDSLPRTLLPATRPYQEWLSDIGCRTLGDLRRLPRAGLQRRTDKRVLESLDRAYGKTPELFDWVQAPQAFRARLELPERIDHAQAALFAANRLLLQMTGWLVTRQSAVSRFTLLLEHERGRSALPPTPLEIALAEPDWREEHLLRLVKERLGRLALNAPVIAMRLEALQFAALPAATGSLFPDPGGSPADHRRLLELLTARLGEHGVLAPAPRADHRPEICNAWIPAATVTRPAPPTSPPAERPFWLFEQPLPLTVQGHRPFYRAPLRMVKGPERIESGWWDGKPVVRDYFIAQDDKAAFYWIYRERISEDVRWFLQGLFA